MYFIKKLYCYHVVIPLIFGGLIYISLRSLSLRMFSWFKWIKIDFLISLIRTTVAPLKSHLPSWIYFSLPDALWVYSFSSSFLILWKDEFRIGKYWLLPPIILGSIVEVAQGLKLFPGTFDMWDLIFTIFALCLSVIIVNYKFNQNDKQKPSH